MPNQIKPLLVETPDADSFIRQREYKQFLKNWRRDYTCPTSGNIDALIAQIKQVEQMGLNRNIITVLASHKEAKLLYVSANFSTMLGYDKVIRNWPIFVLFKLLNRRQLLAPIKAHNWGNNFIKSVPSTFIKENPKNYLCGLQLKSKSGSWRTFFASSTRMTFDERNQPSLSVVFAEDITPIYKGNFYWSRFIRGHQQEYTRFCTSRGSKSTFKDLISPREMDILQLILQQKESREISNLLHISIKTVEQHRKNMIARSGAKDMTALIQLCRMAEVI